MFIILLLACGSGSSHSPGGETIDIVEGTYTGYLAEGDMDFGVRVADEDSTLDVRFYEHEAELWAFVSFRGKMAVRGVVFTAEDLTIEGVTVDGDDLTTEVRLDGLQFGVTGRFEDEDQSLALDIEDIGALPLYLVEP